MVCNTIHLFYDELQRETKTPILDLRKAVKKEIIRRKIKRVLILGTPLTIRKGLYHDNHYTCIEPSESELKELSKRICAHNRGAKKEEHCAMIHKLCEKYIGQGAEVIIAGCTEFALMLAGSKLPVIDAIDVLIDTTIKKFFTSRPAISNFKLAQQSAGHYTQFEIKRMEENSNGMGN